MPQQVKRALIVTRLSKVTDATTSPERQREICEELCVQRGYQIVGIAQDLDVSGAVDPFDRRKRPTLSRWLANESEPFDVLVCYRVDRLTRSIRHLQKLVNWAEDHGKLVVSATESHFDMTTTFAHVVIALMGTVAQMELEAISERNASKTRRDIKLGKYRGGTPPWGYKAQRDEAGVWRLVQDPDQVAIIHEVVQRVLDSEPLQRIAHDLTRRGVLTHKDRVLQLQGKPTRGTAWNVTPLKRSLLNEAMLGYAISGGKPVRNEDGSPVVRSKPILSREVFNRLRVELEGRSTRGEPRKASSSLLLRVLHCGVCELPAYKFNGGSHSQFPRYRCKSMTTATKCGNGTIRVDKVDSLVDRTIETLLGQSERLVRVWDSGSDNSAELAEVEAELSDITGLIGTGPYKAGTPLRAQLDTRIALLTARYEALVNEVTTPAGWRWEPTGEQFGKWWEAQDTEGRNIWLRSMHVRAEYRGDHINLDLGDIYKLAEQVDPQGSITGWMELLDAMREGGIAGLEIDADTFRAHSASGQVISL